VINTTSQGYGVSISLDTVPPYAWIFLIQNTHKTGFPFLIRKKGGLPYFARLEPVLVDKIREILTEFMSVLDVRFFLFEHS